MDKLIDRLSVLYPKGLGHFNNKKKKFGENEPREWASYCYDHRFFAVCSYVLDHDVQGFIDHMKKASAYFIKTLQKYEESGLDYGFAEDASCRMIPTVICSLETSMIKDVLTYTSKRDTKKMDPLAKYLHKAFRLFILGKDGTRADLDDMETIFSKRLKSYVGYALCFQAIHDKDKEKFLAGFDTMIKGHKRLSTPQGVFGGTVDEVIAFWPLAVVNLARFKGLDVMVDYPLVPKDLIAKQLGGLYD